MADGTISDLQLERLEGLGAWLAVNGEAIFGTRPWHTAEGETREKIGVRFTQKPDALYAILLDMLPGVSVTLSGLRAEPGMIVSLPGLDMSLTWQQASEGITVTFPTLPPSTPAMALKLTPQPSMASLGGA